MFRFIGSRRSSLVAGRMKIRRFFTGLGSVNVLARHGSAGDPTLQTGAISAQNLYQRRLEVGFFLFFSFPFQELIVGGFIMTTVPARLTWELGFGASLTCAI